MHFWDRNLSFFVQVTNKYKLVTNLKLCKRTHDHQGRNWDFFKGRERLLLFLNMHRHKKTCLCQILVKWLIIF